MLPRSGRRQLRADRGHIGAELVYFGTDARLRGTDRQLIEADHVHIVTDSGLLGADYTTIFMLLRFDATRDPVCGAAAIPFCANSVRQGTDCEIPRTGPAPFGDVIVALGTRFTLGATDSEPTHSDGQHWS